MNLSVVLNIHDNSKIVFDTLDSIQTWMTNDILVIVDGEFWDKLCDLSMNAYKLEGFRHACSQAPYRNIHLGLLKAAEQWPDSDWYCYLEYDCLVGSDEFWSDLKVADKMGVWCLGNDHRIGNRTFPIVENKFGIQFKESHYLLGCCIFYKREFIENLMEMDYFNKFLNMTNSFAKGFFPHYDGYDITEHLMPSLAANLGGKVAQLASFTERLNRWNGNYQKYPLRFRPELDEMFTSASIMHPVKNYDNPLRVFHREKRENVRR